MAATRAEGATVSSRPLQAPFDRSRHSAALVRLLDHYFYLFMSLLIAGVVAYGFSRTVGAKLIHPAIARPFILHLHAAIFCAWVVLFILQSALIRRANLRLHRGFGWFGAVLGAAVFVAGIQTAITMARFNIVHFHSRFADRELLISFYDITAFGVAFALAVLWRRKPETHRRLILVATCALTAAAFGRFPLPPHVRPPVFFYGCVDLLILFGVARDLLVSRRVHTVYRYALPVFVICQAAVVHAIYHPSAYWLTVARFILN